MSNQDEAADLEIVLHQGLWYRTLSPAAYRYVADYYSPPAGRSGKASQELLLRQQRGTNEIKFWLLRRTDVLPALAQSEDRRVRLAGVWDRQVPEYEARDAIIWMVSRHLPLPAYLQAKIPVYTPADNWSLSVEDPWEKIWDDLKKEEVSPTSQSDTTAAGSLANRGPVSPLIFSSIHELTVWIRDEPELLIVLATKEQFNVLWKLDSVFPNRVGGDKFKVKGVTDAPRVLRDILDAHPRLSRVVYLPSLAGAALPGSDRKVGRPKAKVAGYGLIHL